MANIEPGDIVTYYFIVKDSDDGNKFIKAWTDKKTLAEYYMEFHKCSSFKLKKITKPIEDIYKILEENHHDEIGVTNILSKSRKKNRNGEMDYVTIPMTKTELTLVEEEANTFCSSTIGYGYLDGVLPYLKGKYQNALSTLFLNSIIMKTVRNKNDKYVEHLGMDRLSILFKWFADEFE